MAARPSPPHKMPMPTCPLPSPDLVDAKESLAAKVRLQDLALLTPARKLPSAQIEVAEVKSAAVGSVCAKTTTGGSASTWRSEGEGERAILLTELRHALDSNLEALRFELRQRLKDSHVDQGIAGEELMTGLSNLESKVDALHQLVSERRLCQAASQDNVPQAATDAGDAHADSRLDALAEQVETIVERLMGVEQRLASTDESSATAPTSAGPRKAAEHLASEIPEDSESLSRVGSSHPLIVDSPGDSAILTSGWLTNSVNVATFLAPPNPDQQAESPAALPRKRNGDRGSLMNHVAQETGAPGANNDANSAHDLWQSRILRKLSTEKKVKKLASRPQEFVNGCMDTLQRRLPHKCKFCSKHVVVALVGTFNILANSIFIGYQENFAMEQALLFAQGRQEYQKPPDWMRYAEIGFAVLFSMELCLRLILFGRATFRDSEKWWSLFDFVLLVVAILELALRKEHSSSGRMLSFMRILRAVRVFRAFKSLRTLRVMIAMIGSALFSVLWAMVFLFMFVYMYGVFLMQGLSRHMIDTGRDMSQDRRTIIDKYYGSIWSTITSLMASITGGEDWLQVANPLKVVHVGYFVSFVTFVLFIVFGVMNILTGIFVQSAKNMARFDRDLVIEEQISNLQSHTNRLRWIFEQADVDRSGTIHFDELMTHLESKKVQAYLHTLDVEPSDATTVFDQVKDKDNEVPINTFIKALLNRRFSAKNVDMVKLLSDSQRNSERQHEYLEYIVAQFKTIEEALEIHVSASHDPKYYLRQLQGAGTVDGRRAALQQRTMQGPKLLA